MALASRRDLTPCLGSRCFRFSSLRVRTDKRRRRSSAIPSVSRTTGRPASTTAGLAVLASQQAPGRLTATASRSPARMRSSSKTPRLRAAPGDASERALRGRRRPGLVARRQIIAFSRYTGSSRSGAWIVDLASGSERQLSHEYPMGLAWSPTGDVIAAVGHLHVGILLARTERRRHFDLQLQGLRDGRRPGRPTGPGSRWAADGSSTAPGRGSSARRRRTRQ